MPKGKWLGAGLACAGAVAFGALPVNAGVPEFSWTGVYIGGHVGGSFGQDDLNFHDDSVDQDLIFHSGDDNGGFLGGAHGGFNWQSGNVVFGIEGDGSFGSGIDYLASVRGRLGLASGKWLIYVTGGAGFIGVNQDFRVTSDAGTSHYSWDRTDTGYVLGFGAECAVWPNVTVGADGLYYSFSDERAHLHTPTAQGAEPFTVRSDLNTWAARLRVTMYFNGPY